MGAPCQYVMSFLCYNHLNGEERTGFFTLIVFLMSCYISEVTAVTLKNICTFSRKDTIYIFNEACLNYSIFPIE